MAKPEHLDKLLEGVEVWNMWRYEISEIVPALWGADLVETDLRDADFRDADLEEADLSGADLGDADLRGAKLRGANLRGATLCFAVFENTDLKRVDLEGADLMGAIHLRAEQLCEVKTLYQAKLDPDLEIEVKERCPHLLEFPEEPDETDE
jgi:uncharacterized protein YjbI with pentapeptide repeats